MLGLFPHPDDEAYAAGGLLAQCAERGAAVEIVCATRGEQGSDRRGGTPGGPALAALRSMELAASCAALGISPPVFLDLPDGALVTVHASAGALLDEHLRRVRPHLVVSLGADGVYGNLDHLAWADIVAAAVRRQTPAPRFLQAAFPRGLFTPLWRALRRRPGPPLVADLDPDRLGIERAAADLRLDIRALRSRKLAAIAAHASQLNAGDPLSLLRPGVVERLLDEEWYTVADGPPLPVDAMDALAALP